MSDAAFWDKIAPKYAKDPISDMASYVATLDRMKDILKPHHRVLEIGCGTGTTAMELAPGVDRYIGTDISRGMITIAEGKKADAHNVEFLAKAADDIPAPPHDVILALNLLHLVPDVSATLRAVHSGLSSGGYFIAKTALLQDGAWFLRPIIPVMRAFGKAPQVTILGQEMFLDQIRDVGFEIVETLLQPGIAPRLFTVARKI